MGFDLYYLTPAPGAIERTEAAWQTFLSLRDRDAPLAERQEALITYERTQGDFYYRFGWSGMAVTIRRMSALGMLTSEMPPPWPPTETRPSPNRRDEIHAVRAYGAADHGIPADKFRTNDGWILRPDQIRAALTNYERSPEKERARAVAEEPSWPEWIAYLRRACDHDGIEVW